MNRITKKNLFLKKYGKKAFVSYITAGFPDLSTTEKLVEILEENGVDIVELGMPFSDPIADGPTIQYASSQALEKGINLGKFFKLIRKIRKKSEIPLIMMSYYNPILQFGLKRFAHQAALAGLDGVIVPDMPPEEAKPLNAELSEKNLFLIFLVSPVTEEHRIKKIARESKGFIYYVSLTGVTGMRDNIADDLAQKIKLIKKTSTLPVYVGFGISNPEQAKFVLKYADGVIFGSAIIKQIQKNYGKKNFLQKIAGFIKNFTRRPNPEAGCCIGEKKR
ncbi:MAG: tryptophan synthase subunit alpha [Candidatus Omnitrophica bacterium]|nr:tryptophan synthase subunit alpha [Candidatus Omnitrophota bacterium]